MIKSITLILLQINFLLTLSENNEVKLRKIYCNPNPMFLTNATCKISVIGREIYNLNMDADIINPLSNITVTVKSFKLDNGYHPHLINIKVNLCNILSRKTLHPLHNYALKLATKFSNINHTCPYSGHLFVRNGHYIPGIVNSLFPTGMYKLSVNVFEGHPPVSIGSIDLYVDTTFT